MALRSTTTLGTPAVQGIPVNIRGWEARTLLDDAKVGSVHDVLVDDTGAARYLDIDLGLLRKHVLLPVGQAITDATRDVVWVEAMDKHSFERIPEYEHDPDGITADFERRLTTSYDESTHTRRYLRPEYGGFGGVAYDAASVDPTVLGTEEVRLRRLSELDDYEVADDDPDPRGWQLVTADGETIGAVDDLVVDPQAMRARYLEVELQRDVATDRAEHALIPVGYARLDENERRVRVNALDRTDVGMLPRYHAEFDEDYEARLERHFARQFEGESLYRHPRYDANRLYGTRADERQGATVTDRRCDVRLRR